MMRAKAEEKKWIKIERHGKREDKNFVTDLQKNAYKMREQHTCSRKT